MVIDQVLVGLACLSLGIGQCPRNVQFLGMVSIDLVLVSEPVISVTWCFGGVVWSLTR